MKQLIEDLISAMEYHVEQTRPIHSTTVALQAAREALRAQHGCVPKQPSKDEALKLALEILHYLEALNSDTQRQKMEAVTAIKQALAAPVQEPVAVPKIEWVNTSSDWVVHYLQAKSIFNAEQIGEMMDFAALAANKFYATPPAAQPTTEESSEAQTASAYVKTYHGGKSWPLQPAHVQQILAAFPLLDDEGLDQDEHHCEWALQQDRKRLHAMLAHGITKGQP